jgi:hypothetical protein
MQWMGGEPRVGVAPEPPHRNGGPPGDDGPGGAGGSGEGPGREGDGDAPGVPRSRLLRVSLLVALVVLLGLWGYALVYSVTRKDPERLSSAQRQQVLDACHQAADDMRALPGVTDPPTNATVSARATGETDALAHMVATLRHLEPSREAARQALDAWLDDWNIMLHARRTYAQEVLHDKSATIVTPVDAGAPIFVRMNKYAESKGLEDCTVESLGATSVNALRRE